MIKQRVSRAASAATAVAALALLAACGSSTPPAGSAGPATPAAAPSPSATASPSPSSKPSDETENVQAATKTFMTAAFSVGYPDSDETDHADRVKPLMTEDAYAKAFPPGLIEQSLATVKSRFGPSARSRPRLLGAVKVSALSTDHATVTVKFEPTVQRKSDGGWKTIKRGVDESETLELVHQDGSWLVDEAR